MRYIGRIICNKTYAKYLRSIELLEYKILILELDKILDWNNDIGQWKIFIKNQ